MNNLKLEAASIATDEQTTKKRIIVVIDGLGGVDYHRTAMPFAYIKEKGIFEVKYLSPKDGTFLSNTETLEGGKSYSLKNPANSGIVVWIKRK